MIRKSLSEILDAPESLPDSWLYLPPGKWTLNTEGVFSEDSSLYPPGSDEYLPVEVKEEGWIEVLEKQAIEDVVDNVGYQLKAPSLDKLLEAFVYYYENDAFLEF